MPAIDEFEWLVVMGGPMGVRDRNAFHWLDQEVELIRSVIRNEKRILGVCLGAQLMAHAMGARVERNPHKEIGWFPVESAQENTGRFKEVLPPSFNAFHWHGDTFGIPENAQAIGSSEATRNQGFSVGLKTLALQFHLELRPQDASRIAQACPDDLTSEPYVQKPKDFTTRSELFETANALLEKMLVVQENGT
tara:strand:- start:122 stop:700 length:579 start_codon:yes stop_codon:yes gene_type:complete